MTLAQQQPDPGRALSASRRDWVYVYSLLLPFAIYDLTLKALLVFAAPQDPETVEALGLMQIRLTAQQPPTRLESFGLLWSNLFFTLAYIALWSGLLSFAWTGVWRRIMLGLLHGLTVAIVVITTVAYQYFVSTGSTLDFDTLVLGLSSLEDMRGLITSQMYAGILLSIILMLLYSVLGPRLLTFLGDRYWGSFDTTQPEVGYWRRRLRLSVFGVLAGGLFWLSLLPGAGPAGVSKAFARNAFVNVLLTAGTIAQVAQNDAIWQSSAERLPSDARLVSTPSTRRRNVVLIMLESTRAAATTPYNTALPTTPFLDELAKRSLLVEQAYAIVPHTHSALTAINCGIYPPLDPSGVELLAMPGTLPPICLPHLLQAQGYTTAYFMSQTAEFENSQHILQNQGYEYFLSLEHMDTAGFEPTNYFGVEDEVMLEPSRSWLQSHGDKPFLAAYLTSAPHHDYLAPFKRHGRVDYTGNDVVNRYLNSVRNQDYFLKQLFEQYRELGLYDDTVFVLLGDHGQGFGEHGRNGHDNAIYEEGLRIPLMIHDPKRFKTGTRLEGPVSQLDILPTVAGLLGFGIEGGPYRGSSLLRPLPGDRTLLFSCSGGKRCMASLHGTAKYIHHFDDRPEELFDLASDPAELSNIAAERPAAELSRRRDELLAWRAKVRAMYGLVGDE